MYYPDKIMAISCKFINEEIKEKNSNSISIKINIFLSTCCINLFILIFYLDIKYINTIR